MIAADLAARAGALGIATGYHRIGGAWQTPSAESLARIVASLESARADPAAPPSPLPDDTRPGHLPDALMHGGRRWGVSLQLYGLRSRGNWGIGDFTDLAAVARLAGAAGADALMVNPLHAPFRGKPAQASPYAPSSRLFLNWLYIDVAAVPGFDSCAEVHRRLEAPAFRARLDAAREAALVAYADVAACKLEALRCLYDHFRARQTAGQAGLIDDFARFRDAGGDALRRFCLFEALQEARDTHHADGWPDWPVGLRDPHSDEVRAFEAAHTAETGFAAWLQWVARRQLDRAADAARAAGMEIGLVADIAVGADAAGADAWADQGLVALDMELGAPPDPFAPDGQTWGAPPWRPNVLRARGMRPFADMLAAAMGWAGAVRLDHVIGLERQFWVPRGLPAREGTYVAFPREALLDAACAAGRAHGAVLIGEDLGTVPDGFRDHVRARHMLTMSVMRFEKAGDRFTPPSDYPAFSIACAGTHDLVPLAGFAAGTDITARAHAAPGTEDTEGAFRQRAAEVASLQTALTQEGLAVPEEGTGSKLADAVHRFLARTPCVLVMAQLEDLLGVDVQPNLPGTVDGHPNWQRRYPVTLESLAADGVLAATGALFAGEGRGRTLPD